MCQSPFIYLVILSFSMVCCQPEPEKQAAPPAVTFDPEIHLISQALFTKDTLPPYSEIKSEIRTQQSALKNEFQSATSDSAQVAILTKTQKYLLTQLTDQVFPKWYGTDWDFNGISETPGEGAIACGYFVSTTLRDIGFNLNRYRVAQQDATTIIKVLCDPPKTFNDLQKVINHIWESPEALYIVGLDQHVGFLYRGEKEVFFIHSSYADPVAVVREKATESAVLNYSRIYVVGKLTGSDTVAKRWLKGERISIQ
ncbi:hypothetical protein N9933_00650 [bacterium]|nr:hypothetical protein [bacterium]